MIRVFRWALAFSLLTVVPAWSADARYAIKETKAAPPSELKEPIRKLLNEQSIELLDGKGKALCQVWFRKEVPAEKAKSGLTYRDLKETTLIGAIKYTQPGGDFRMQKIKPGVYTLRLAFQPMDGDHMGVSPYTEFLLVLAAAKDATPAPMEPKKLYEQSARSIGTTHAGVLMLFPYEKPIDKPKLSKQGSNWVLGVKEGVVAEGKKVPLGFGLTLVGSAE